MRELIKTLIETLELQAIGGVTLFWLAHLCATYVLMNFFWKRYRERLTPPLQGGTRATLLVANSFILVLLFTNPPTKLEIKWGIFKATETRPYIMNPQDPRKHEIKDNKLLELEVKKAFDEIQARIGHIDNWFHWKFILVGGVMLAFLTGHPGGLKGPLHETVKSPAVALLLASSCVIAFAADIHIRIEGAMTGMLGRWISDYVEPVSSKALYWENFLRDPEGHALHTSYIAQFTYAPHLHFLTWPLYISYIWVFQEIALQGRTDNTSLIRGSFILVQVSLFVFVLVAHSTPLAYQLKVLDHKAGFFLAGVLFFYFWIIALSTPYFAIAGTGPDKIQATNKSLKSLIGG